MVDRIIMAKSDEYIYRCIDIIKNDKNISEQTIVIMFLQYKELLTKEINEQRASRNLDKTKSRGH
jgi:hypothetical protein